VAQASGPVLLFDHLRDSRGKTTQAGRPVPHGTSRNKNAVRHKNSSRPTKRRGFSSTGLQACVGFLVISATHEENHTGQEARATRMPSAISCRRSSIRPRTEAV
jgi:hypothetical protein